MAEIKPIQIHDFQMNSMIDFAMKEMQREIKEIELLEAEHELLAKELAKELQKPQKVL